MPMRKNRVISEEGRRRMIEGGRKGGKKATGYVGFAVLKDKDPELFKKLCKKNSRHK